MRAKCLRQTVLVHRSVVVVLLAVSSLACQSSTSSAPSSIKTAPITSVAEPERICGVEVYTRTVGSSIFPDDWRQGKINANATPLASHEVERSLAACRIALSKYPETVLQRNLKAIYWTGGISFYGLGYGGTNSRDAIYLSNEGPTLGFTDDYLEASIHHEFSSILMRNNLSRFPRAEWFRVNPPEFGYGTGGTEAVRENRDRIIYDPELYASGFLAEYAKSDLEEDFNMIAEGLFSADKEYWDAVDSSARLRKKMKLAVQFYHGLDARFTEKRFRALAGQ